MKKFFTISGIAALALLASSCVHKGDLDLDPVPEISFELAKLEGNTYLLTNTSKGATGISWKILSYKSGSKEVVLESRGEEFQFTFPSIGVYWIQMTATRDGREETIYTTKLVDKASPVSINDGSFDDWDAVTNDGFKLIGRYIGTPEDEREGVNAFVDGKFDYDGDNVYFLVKVNADYAPSPMGCMDGGDEGNEFIIFINSDGDMGTTGKALADEGYEYLVEFNFWDGNSSVSFVGTSEEYGGWDSLPDADQAKYGPAFRFGTTKEIDGVYWFEFALSRSVLGITKSAFGAQFQITRDWDTCDYLMTMDGETDMIFSLASDE